MADVIPFITYENGVAALEWLSEAFGFRETAPMTTPDGQLAHGELSTAKWADHAGQSVGRVTRVPRGIGNSVEALPPRRHSHGASTVFSSLSMTWMAMRQICRRDFWLS
jgi:hypothetical protein